MSLPSPSSHLFLHGSIVLLFGLLLGVPYARAVKSAAADQVVNSWRVAHLSLPLGATLMFAVAALLPQFSIPVTVSWAVAVALIVSAYSFCISTPLAAVTRDRGLASGATGLARLVYLGNVVGAASSLVAALGLVYAAFVAL